MIIAWLTLFVKLGTSPKIFLNFLLDVNPFLKAGVLANSSLVWGTSSGI